MAKQEMGIRVQPDGRIRCYVTVGVVYREKTFDAGTELGVCKRWRESTKVELRLTQPESRRGTLEVDVDKWLDSATRQLKSGYKAQRSELRAWVALYGTWPRAKIRRAEVRAAQDKWTAAKVAPKTINHRVRTLAQLYHDLDGPRCPTPCDDVPKLDVPTVLPKFVAVSTIKRVAKNLADRPLDQARFMVLTSTGQRPAQLKRALLEDVDLVRRVWWVRPAKKGNPIPVYLNDDMRAAWRLLIERGGLAEDVRSFDTSDYDKRLYAAGWPRDIRPYNAKHTVGLALAEAGVDYEDIRDFFGHKDTKTTRIYTGLVASRLKSASTAIAGRGLGYKNLGADLGRRKTPA
jgi:integrase